MKFLIRNSLPFILLFLFTLEVVSQINLNGTILDSESNPTPGIAVVLKSADKNNVIAYTYSDDNGFYELSIKLIGEYSLSVQGMGYASRDIPIAITTPGEAAIQKNITLIAKAFELKEVEINAETPILIKEDTISINTKVFIDGTEEVAEDILKKLPGIEVANDGSISVQGKQVEKVLVEGDDLFEQGYKLLTKNLNAGVIDKVQILEHFSDNPLLNNIQDSDKVALNLTLKVDQKSTLFGNASLGLGSENFYEGKMNLISFQEKSKYYLFANANNRGVDATGDIFQLVYPDLFTAPPYIGDGESADRYLGITLPTPNLKQSRFKFNNAELASINAIYNPTDKIKLKALAYFASDENSFVSESLYQFDVPQVTFTNTEVYKLRKKTKVGYGKWDALISLGKDERLDYIGRFNKGEFLDRASLLFNTESVLENATIETLFTDQRITYTRRLANKGALQFTGRYIYDEKPEQYNVNAFLYQELFPEQTTIEAVRQQNSNKLNFAGVEGTYILNKSRNYLELNSGVSVRNQHLVSDLYLIDGDNPQAAGGEYINQMKNQLDDFYAKLNYKYSFQKIQLKTELAFHQYRNTTVQRGRESRNALFVLIPRLGFLWQPKPKVNFIVSYKHDSSSLTTRDLRTGYVLSSYRYFTRGHTGFQMLPGNYWFSGLNYGSWSDSFSLSVSYFLNNNKEYLSTNRRITPNYSLSENILLDGKQFTGVSLSMSQYLKDLSSSLRAKFSYNENNYENRINSSEIRSLDIQSYTFGGEFKSIVTSTFDFVIGSEWTRSVVNTESESVNTDNSSFLDLIWQPNKKLNISLKNERYYFGNLSAARSFYFSDLEARYKAIPNKLTLHFLAPNIWNTDTFRNYSINETGFNSSTFRLLPRYFFLKVDYRF